MNVSPGIKGIGDTLNCIEIVNFNVHLSIDTRFI